MSGRLKIAKGLRRTHHHNARAPWGALHPDFRPTEPKTVELPLAKLPMCAAMATEPIARCEIVVPGIGEKRYAMEQGIIEPCSELGAKEDQREDENSPAKPRPGRVSSVSGGGPGCLCTHNKVAYRIPACLLGSLKVTTDRGVLTDPLSLGADLMFVLAAR